MMSNVNCTYQYHLVCSYLSFDSCVENVALVPFHALPALWISQELSLHEDGYQAMALVA